MLCSRALDSTHAPNYVESQAVFKFYNRSGEKLFGTEETDANPCDLNPISNKLQKACLSPSISPIFTHVEDHIDEHNIDQPLSLTNELFLEESSDQTILPTILEELLIL